jgi:hypothetical protein
MRNKGLMPNQIHNYPTNGWEELALPPSKKERAAPF